MAYTFIRRTGSPENEWAKMLLKEALRMTGCSSEMDKVGKNPAVCKLTVFASSSESFRSMPYGTGLVTLSCSPGRAARVLLVKRVTAIQSERKEVAPFCLAVVSAIELVFEMAGVPLGFRLLAGLLLACVWGSLRFVHGACTAPSSLSVQGWVLRGSAWRT